METNNIFSCGENFDFKFEKTLKNIKLEPSSPKRKKENTIEINKNKIETKENNMSEKRQKLNNGDFKNKLRKLTTAEKTNPNEKLGFNRMKFIKIIIFLFSLVVVILAICSEKIRNELIVNYQNQYNILVHGKINYCSQEFNYKNITKSFEKKLIGQEIATKNIYEIFDKHRDFTSIILLGNTGVGKTYTSSLIEENFQWSENIYFYIWSEESGNDQITNVLKIIEKFSKCGHNLLFIDDLTYDDRNYIQSLNEIIKKQTKIDNFKIIIFYIFNLSRNVKMSTDLIKSHINTLRLLENINIVEYRDLNNNDIFQCIELVSRMLNFPLTPGQKSDVVTSLFGTETGCKNVYSKVLLYANDGH